MEGLLKQHLLVENIKFVMESVRAMEKKKNTEIVASWYMAVLNELQTSN